MAAFGNLLTAMITPFTPDGEVDYGKAWDLALHLNATGSDGIVVGGTTGESPTLTHDEKVALFRTVVEAVGGKALVIAGTGTYDTRESVELTRQAQEVGCDGAMAVTPYYSKPPQEGLFRHFSAIADASDLPVMLYNIPGRTSLRIEIDTLVRLAAHPRIVAVKDAVDDVAFSSKVRLALPEGFDAYSGSDAFTLPLLSIGAVGLVSVASHLAGPQLKRMITAAFDKDWTTALALHEALMPLFGALFVETNPIPVKAALSHAWEPVGEPRLPLVPARTSTVTAVLDALEAAQRA